MGRSRKAPARRPLPSAQVAFEGVAARPHAAPPFASLADAWRAWKAATSTARTTATLTQNFFNPVSGYCLASQATSLRLVGQRVPPSTRERGQQKTVSWTGGRTRVARPRQDLEGQRPRSAPLREDKGGGG